MTVFVELAPGLCAEVTCRIVEEALPTPHEVCHFRAPQGDEFSDVVFALANGREKAAPPFPIEGRTWSKPMPADGVEVARSFSKGFLSQFLRTH